MPVFPAFTRAVGVARLDDFVRSSGEIYADRRNTDLGPGAVPTTSTLSPYLRRRLVLEDEVAAAAIGAHGREGSEKFVQEVFWRSYFKGHLETHPTIWTTYQQQVIDGHADLAVSSGLRHVYEQAIAGRTNIAGFDDWARELVEHGWLHNHARMWFASIWIFTLRLPWALGAEFFLQHLLDGDPASNTLSWRWVAGLHTRGKAYLARAENIARYTKGRFNPTGLNEDPEPLTEDITHPLVPLARVAILPHREVALLLHLDDLHPESLDLGSARVMAIGGLIAHADGASEQVRSADRDAMADALVRAEAHYGCPVVPFADGWAGDLPVVAPWAPVGPSAAALPPCMPVRRAWDERTWPRTTKGYFALRSAISQLLDAADIG
ncbi:MAG TPA: FAD-binding domain-containing protein [Sphingomonas sp.]|jgi:deoxyribodipyrimidine photo-lyase|uniref:FAD-binding domain-containing protein n=1 Tax=Sphingomonas sp. TaxID=28214 RepID=UPI002EDB20D4